MINYIVTHFKISFAVICSVIATILGFAWTFILMGYNTKAATENNTVQIVEIQRQVSNIRTEQAESLGVIKSVKSDTEAIKKILYNRALKAQNKE